MFSKLHRNEYGMSLEALVRVILDLYHAFQESGVSLEYGSYRLLPRYVLGFVVSKPKASEYLKSHDIEPTFDALVLLERRTLLTAGIPPVIGYNKERDEEFTAVIPLFESANVDELKAMDVREIEISEDLQMIKDRVLEGPFVYQVRGAE